MKKEIMSLLKLGNDDRGLKINELFRLEARYFDKYGVNVGLSHNEPNDVKLYVTYIGHAAKMLYSSKEINSREYDAVIKEIKELMEAILDEIKENLVKNFLNGYIG